MKTASNFPPTKHILHSPVTLLYSMLLLFSKCIFNEEKKKNIAKSVMLFKKKKIRKMRFRHAFLATYPCLLNSFCCCFSLFLVFKIASRFFLLSGLPLIALSVAYLFHWSIVVLFNIMSLLMVL